MKHKKAFAILRKAAVVLLAAAAFMSLASCGNTDKSILWYQDGLKTVKCHVVTNKGEYDSFDMRLDYGESDTAEILRPVQLIGALFTRSADSSSLDIGGKSVDLTEAGLGDIDTILDAFKLKEENISSVSKNDDGDTVFGVLIKGGVYTVTLDEEGLPKKIDFDGNSTIRITDISLFDDPSELEENTGHVVFVTEEPETDESAETVTDTTPESAAE